MLLLQQVVRRRRHADVGGLPAVAGHLANAVPIDRTRPDAILNSSGALQFGPQISLPNGWGRDRRLPKWQAACKMVGQDDREALGAVCESWATPASGSARRSANVSSATLAETSARVFAAQIERAARAFSKWAFAERARDRAPLRHPCQRCPRGLS